MLIRAVTLMVDIGRVSPDRQSTQLMTDMYCFKTAILKTAAIKTVAVMAILMGAPLPMPLRRRYTPSNTRTRRM